MGYFLNLYATPPTPTERKRIQKRLPAVADSLKTLDKVPKMGYNVSKRASSVGLNGYRIALKLWKATTPLPAHALEVRYTSRAFILPF